MKVKVTEFKLLAWLKDNPSKTAKDMATAFGVTPATIWKTLVPAVKAGRIVAEKVGKVPHYSISQDGIECHKTLAEGGTIVLYDDVPKVKPKSEKVTWLSLFAYLNTHGGYPGWTSNDIAEALGVKLPAVWKIIVPALKRGYLHKKQIGKKRYYRLTELGKQWLQEQTAIKSVVIHGKLADKADHADVKKPFASQIEAQVYETLVSMLPKYYGAANVAMKMAEKFGGKYDHSAVEQHLETLFAKGLAKKAPYKTYLIFKAVPLNEAQPPQYNEGIVIQEHKHYGAHPDFYKKKLHIAPAFDDIPQKEVVAVDAEKVAKDQNQGVTNCGGATDVVMGEDEYLKHKEYGYKVLMNVVVVAAQPHVNHWDGFCEDKKAAIADWNLDAKLDLKRECADFYALYDLSLDFEDVADVFKGKRDLLAAQFANYIDMAVGGEFRHAAHKVYNQQALVGKAPIIQLVINGQLPADRSACWRHWKQVRKERGLDALRQVELVYKQGQWSGGYGGVKWGKGAETLRMFLEGALTPTIFVDTVWSLQHNNGFILNKVWNVHGLDTILNYKFAGQIESVVPYASEEVQKLWKEKKNVKA